MDINSVNITFGQTNSKDWIDILSAMLTPFVAILGTYIAFQQWRISKTLENFQIEQHKHDNYEVPLKKLLKSYIEKLLSDNKEINKKELTLKFIDEICSILEKNYYLFDSDDEELIEEACDNLKMITQNLEPIKTMGLKRTWKVICDYYHYSCLLTMPLLANMPDRDRPYVNIFDVFWLTLIGIIQFFTPHYIDKKFTKHVMPKIILTFIIWEIIKYIICSLKDNKKKKKAENENIKQLELFEKRNYTNN